MVMVVVVVVVMVVAAVAVVVMVVAVAVAIVVVVAVSVTVSARLMSVAHHSGTFRSSLSTGRLMLVAHHSGAFRTFLFSPLPWLLAELTALGVVVDGGRGVTVLPAAKRHSFPARAFLPAQVPGY
jgi:hypothetical protein